MTRHHRSLDSNYFEKMFQGDPDPWRLETSPYEASKFDHTITALGGRVYERAFEVGCAGGSLTQRLAPHCADLLAIDISETAVARARRRCAALSHVRIERMRFPRTVPSLTDFDLMVLSEVTYYWDDVDLGRAANAVRTALAPGGDLLLVHYTGETDYPQSGDQAVEMLAKALAGEVEILKGETRDRYRLDLWRRR